MDKIYSLDEVVRLTEEESTSLECEVLRALFETIPSSRVQSIKNMSEKYGSLFKKCIMKEEQIYLEARCEDGTSKIVHLCGVPGIFSSMYNLKNENVVLLFDE